MTLRERIARRWIEGSFGSCFWIRFPASVVHWDHELSAIHAQDDGSYELLFRNGVSERFQLVVGADGAWSRVRPLVSEAQPIYSGVAFVQMGIDDVDARATPSWHAWWDAGLTFALGDSRALIGHRDSNAHLGIHAAAASRRRLD